MAQLVAFGDFKVNQVKHLNLSSELTYLLNCSDVKLVNFEAPIKTEGKPVNKSGPNIYQHIEAPAWLLEHGFNVISTANNHTMDFDIVGLEATRKALDPKNVIGTGLWDEAYSIKKIESRDGKKIGVIACTQCEFGTLTEKNGVGCAWALSPMINKLIHENKNSLDALIVMPHGGVEYADLPLPEWRNLYRSWIDLGADAVIASHPHVPQGWEMYCDKPICYSLGNFCFTPLKKKNIPEHWFESLCCVIQVEAKHKLSMEIHPIIFDYKTQYISYNTSLEFKKHIDELNQILQNDKEYFNKINELVLKLYPHYMELFSRGGFVTSLFQKGFWKGFIEGLLGRGFWKKEHVLNNIQCESHRWAIQRAMILKGKENEKNH